MLFRSIWSSEASHNASLLWASGSPLTTAHYLAQRTIMDVGALIEKLKVLADNSDRCLAMGGAGRERVKTHYSWPAVAKQYIHLWEDQLKRSQNAPQRKTMPIMESFRHYADSVLAPEDLLARIPGSIVDDVSVVEQWTFVEPQFRAMVIRLMVTTADAPVSIGELQQEGFELDCILWLAKKGLRRIIQIGDIEVSKL